jgi:mono/diheme cytochrome c family protein
LQDQEPVAKSDAAAEVAEPNWVTAFPEEVTVDKTLLKRGQQRFNIYCSACHGYNGNGDGLVNQRAMALNASGSAAWTTAKSLHDPKVMIQPVGRIYDTITNGRTSMGPYRDQIPTADRWAIVAYVKALQGTGIKPPAAVVPPAEEDAASDAPKEDPPADGDNQ